MPQILKDKKLLFLLGFLLFLAFCVFSYWVGRGHFTQIDFNTTVKFQDHISRRWDVPFSILSLIGLAEVTGAIWAIMFLIILVKRYWLTAFSLLLFPLGLLTEVYGKLFLYHPSPPYMFYRGVFNFNFPSSYVHTSYSYPSGHVYRVAFLTIFIILYLHLKVSFLKSVLLYLGLALFLGSMMVSRIYLGEHWTSDVIGGLLLGSSFALFSAITLPTKR